MQNFSQKYSTLWQLELVKVSNLLDKIPSFSKTIELCLNFCVGFCISELVLSNYKKKPVHKAQLYIKVIFNYNQIIDEVSH